MFETGNWNWMAKKNYNGNRFYYLDNDFVRYFCRDKKKDEIEKTILLVEKLKKCTDKIKSAGLGSDNASSKTDLCLQLGYTDNYGYYALEDNDRGNYSVPYGLPNENLEALRKKENKKECIP